VKARARLRDLWLRGQHGWPPGFPVAQFPNLPLLLALGGWSVAALAHDSVHSYARATFYVGLSAWGWEELTSGVNWVRRSLGAAGLVYVVIKVGEALEAASAG
jgi:hypothetical protein